MREGRRKADEKLTPGGTKRKSAPLTDEGQGRLRQSPKDEMGRRVSGDQVQALRRILTKLGQEQNLNTSLDQLLIAITEEMGGHSAALWIPDRANGTYLLYETSYDGKIFAGARQLGHPYAARRDRFKRKLIGRALTHGLFAIHDVTRSRFIEPEVAQWMVSRGITSLLCVPLTIGKDSAGVLTVRGTAPNTFSEDKERLARLLAHPIGLAVHLMQLAKQAEQSAIREERSRIAIEIHDSLAQILVEIITRLEVARQTVVPGMDSHRHAQLDQVRNLAQEALTEAQRTVRALGSVQVERQGLLGALRELAVKRSSGIPVAFSVHGEARPLPQETENDLFRIGQEAVNNALKHARATQVRVELVYEADKVKLAVEDDGRGFDLERADEGAGFGLTSLRQRVERVGGQLAILSEVNGGTRIVAEIPGEQPASKRSHV